MKRFLWFTLIVLMLVSLRLIDAPAQAQDNPPMPTDYRDYTAFKIHDNGTITAVYSFAYAQENDDPFSFVIPVPSLPTEVSVGESISLSYLGVETEAFTEDPPRYCAELFPIIGHGHVMSLAPPEAEITQTDVIDPADTPDFRASLAALGHELSDEQLDALENYVAQGMTLVAIKADPPPYEGWEDHENAGITQNISITYTGQTPSIPIGAYPAVQGREMLVFIFGDTQYIPDNYPYTRPDFHNISLRPPHQVSWMGYEYTIYEYLNFEDYYPSELRRIADEYDGQAFITQFADFLPHDLRQTDHQVNLNRSDSEGYPFLFDPDNEAPYLTRYYLTPSVERIPNDPQFVPTESAAPLSNIIHLGDWLDPLEYWGCSSRTTYHHLDDLSDVPNSFRIDDHRFAVAYPDGWQISAFDAPSNEQPVWALAPETVDATDVAAFLQGEPAPPMFVFTPSDRLMYDGEDKNAEFATLFSPLLPAQHGKGNQNTVVQLEVSFDITIRYHPQHLDNFYQGNDDYQGMYIATLITAENWDESADIYQQIVGFALSYEFYAHPDFRHTLFLNGPNFENENGRFNTLIPYPDGWIEQTTENGDIVIAPENADLAESPLIRLSLANRLLPVSSDDGFINLRDAASWQAVVEWTLDEYGLSQNVDWSQQIAEIWGCRKDLPALPISYDGRTGFVRFTHRYVVEVSAPDPIFDENAEMLEELVTGIVSQVITTTESCE